MEFVPSEIFLIFFKKTLDKWIEMCYYIDAERSKRVGPVVQLVRTPACHAGGRGFEPHPGRQYAGVAQW